MASPAPHLKYSLRPGGADDLDGVMAIMDSAFGQRFGEAWTRSQLAGILPMAGVSMVLAECADDDSPIGFSLARTVADESELLLIAVRQNCTRRGIGMQLLDHFLEQARRNGVSTVHLEVRDGNPAVAMYRASGFEPIGRRRNYYRGNDRTLHDAITLARSLQPQ